MNQDKGQIHKSKFPLQDIPENENLAEVLLQRAEEYGDRIAMVCSVTQKQYTYMEFAKLIKRTASALHAKGLKKGDILCIFCPNCIEYSVVTVAVILLGGIITTVNPMYKVGELLYQVNDTCPKYLVCHHSNVETVNAALKEYTQFKEIFVVGQSEEFSPISDLLLHQITQLPSIEYDSKNDTIILPYSSGTTGKPKGVMLTHSNLLSNFHQADDRYITPDILGNEPETYICVLPLFHIFGISVISLFGLWKGNKLVYMERFEINDFVAAVEKYKVTVLHLVPPQVIRLLQHKGIQEGKYDLKHLHTAYIAAAPLKKQQAEDLMSKLGVKCVRQAWGMTEISPVGTVEPIDGWCHGKQGMLVPNTECKVIDIESGRLLGNNQDGEICIKGPQIMKGYWKNIQATVATIDEENFLHTGDIGHFDDEGHLYIADRLKELIKYNAFQVAPAELEAVLLTHPAVADAAVIGIPDPNAGELPKAFVVLKEGCVCDQTEIQNFVASKVSPQKKLRGGVDFVQKIPKSPSGKILRRLLRGDVK